MMTAKNVFGETLLSKAVDTCNIKLFVAVLDGLKRLSDSSRTEVGDRKLECYIEFVKHN